MRMGADHAFHKPWSADCKPSVSLLIRFTILPALLPCLPLADNVNAVLKIDEIKTERTFKPADIIIWKYWFSANAPISWPPKIQKEYTYPKCCGIGAAELWLEINWIKRPINSGPTNCDASLKILKKPVNTKLLVFKKILIYQIVTDLLQISFDSFSKNSYY